MTKLRPETTYSAVVGRVLAIERQKRQLDQTTIATAAGVTQPTWSRIENGESALTVDQLALAAVALGTSASAIMQQVEQAIRGLIGRRVVVQHQSAKQAAQQGLALIGGVALGALILSVLARK